MPPIYERQLIVIAAICLHCRCRAQLIVIAAICLHCRCRALSLSQSRFRRIVVRARVVSTVTSGWSGQTFSVIFGAG